jgi:acyl carrier protein
MSNAMRGSLDEKLKMELKKLIVEECDLTSNPEEIGDEEPLFGKDSKLGLDSIDALQISVAVQQKYNVTITDSKETRRVMKSINTFADFIRRSGT